ncbi:hypothetical protein QUF72_12030 [Desulfobacterales bacterium HSG2]|nr:hypothetical protein [Desulfobacterales bacterium HSG2]
MLLILPASIRIKSKSKIKLLRHLRPDRILQEQNNAGRIPDQK